MIKRQPRSFQQHILLKSSLWGEIHQKLTLGIRWGKINCRVGETCHWRELAYLFSIVSQNFITLFPNSLISWNVLITWFWFFFFYFFTVTSCKIQTLSSISKSSFFRVFSQWQLIPLHSGNSLGSSNSYQQPKEEYFKCRNWRISSGKKQQKPTKSEQSISIFPVIFPVKGKWKFLYSISFKVKTFLKYQNFF